jgi:heme/copper-type cytochrome/quinol oxidase subunit 2
LTPTPTATASPNVAELLTQNLWIILVILVFVVAVAVAFVVRKRRNGKEKS